MIFAEIFSETMRSSHQSYSVKKVFLKISQIYKNTFFGVHSVSLGTDPSVANYNPPISSGAPCTEILNKSPKEDKSPDNSNTLDMFN